MIGLPQALAGWADDLAVLDRDVALALAPWVGRLALAIGPLSGTRTDRTGEPDGYAGLARRGSYERLVHGEWAVADLFPDEFVRRAAAGEHLFLELAGREPRAALRTVAIVSAGPAQLGAPRLAHLAALIVLARRARAGGADFAWGVLEDPSRTLSPGLDADAIGRVLLARTTQTAGADAFAGWRDALGELDWWAIGARSQVSSARAAGARALAIDERLDPTARVLDLEVHRGGAPAALRLDLPPADVCARILRDPFAQGRGARVAAGGARPIDVRFAPGGRRILVVDDAGHVDSWPIPNSLRDHIGNRRRWTIPLGRHVIAIGQAKRVALAVTQDRGHRDVIEVFHPGRDVGTRLQLPAEVREALRAAPGAGVGTCGGVKRPNTWRTDFFVQLAGRLLVLPGFRADADTAEHSTGFVVSAADARVAAVAIDSPRAQWVEVRGGTVDVRLDTGDSGARLLSRLRVTDEAEPLEVRLGFDGEPTGPWSPVVASPAGGGRCTVAVADRPSFTVETGAPPLGVGRMGNRIGVLVQASETRLAWVIDGQHEPLPVASRPIVSASTSPYRPLIAWVTADGEVFVYSVFERGVLMRIQPGEAAR
jgi:hypothetical protein